MTTHNERFGGLKSLYGNSVFSKISKSHVCIIGIGGVGSWAAEAIARSGVSEVTLIDLDEVCVTNTNRQLHALNSTVGKEKVYVMKDRLMEINPDLKVNCHLDFLTADTVKELISVDYDVIIDAIDSATNKCVIINECREKNIPVITCGAAGGKQNPTLIEVADLGEAFNDTLLFRMRKLLRKYYDFDKGEHIKFNILSVYSREKVFIPNDNGEVSQSELPTRNVKLDCYTGLGSASFVTGSFGFAAAQAAIQLIGKEND